MNKIIRLYILLCIAAFITSCGSDDDNQSGQVIVTSDLLLGKWYFFDTYVNGSSIPYDDHEACGKDYIEFKTDGTLWQIDVWNCEEDIEQVGTYTISNGTLRINGLHMNVVKLNSNEFSFLINEDYNEDGSPIDVIYNFDR